jgi:hypothetical protein
MDLLNDELEYKGIGKRTDSKLAPHLFPIKKRPARRDAF